MADFNCGMIRATASGVSAGRCTTTTRRTTITRMGTGIMGMTPGDEWYRRRPAAVTIEAVEGVFAGMVPGHMMMVVMMRRLGVLPRDMAWPSPPTAT